MLVSLSTCTTTRDVPSVAPLAAVAGVCTSPSTSVPSSTFISTADFVYPFASCVVILTGIPNLLASVSNHNVLAVGYAAVGLGCACF